MFEERRFRPFDVDRRVEGFFRECRLLVAGNPDVYVDADQVRTVTESELRSGGFFLELTRDEVSFAELIDGFRSGLREWRDAKSVGLVVVASSSYLKLAEIILMAPIDEVQRVIDLTTVPVAEPFHATTHGCDLDASLVLLRDGSPEPLEPWRRGTWLARTRFGLRTAIEGFGYAIQPLTDDVREELALPSKCLRFVDVRGSVLDAGGGVDVFVDADLLARLEKESSRPWAIAFTDQLVLDFLTAVVINAMAADELESRTWDDIAGTLLGKTIELVARTSDAATLATYLGDLRSEPSRFIAKIEGTLDMRANARRIPVS